MAFSIIISHIGVSSLYLRFFMFCFCFVLFVTKAIIYTFIEFKKPWMIFYANFGGSYDTMFDFSYKESNAQMHIKLHNLFTFWKPSADYELVWNKVIPAELILLGFQYFIPNPIPLMQTQMAAERTIKIKNSVKITSKKR